MQVVTVGAYGLLEMDRIDELIAAGYQYAARKLQDLEKKSD